MTLDTCKKRLNIAVEKEDKVSIQFWQDRITKRENRLPPKPEAKPDGKKSKR